MDRKLMDVDSAEFGDQDRRPLHARKVAAPVRDGPFAIDLQLDGPLQVRGNLEITSGTGRVVARVTAARLCRCGGGATKPFCDGTHARIGFRS
jgi:CDGSH-type Zn-finger protein